MNKKSKGYILAIILTMLAISLVVYEIKKNGINFNIFNIEDGVITKQEEKTEGSKEDNVNNEIKLSQTEEQMLKVNPLGEKVKNNLKYPEKEEIHFKLLNAVDNFKTCKGEFIEEIASQNARMKCSFIVDAENSTSVTVYDTEEKKPITLIYHDEKRKVFDDNDNTYKEFEEIKYKGKPTIVRPFRLFVNSELNRADINYLGASRYIICSDSITQYLFIYEDWNYEESTFLGRGVYKLEGVIDQALTTMNKGKFSLIMDKETGVMLQFLSFDDNGNVKYKLECTKFEINTPIEENIYIKDTSGYVKK